MEAVSIGRILKVLLLLFIMVILPLSHAVDTVTHYAQPSGYYYGEPGVHTWIDWCPLCGERDCLSWNPKGANPGEWTCLECGADYDGTNGYDKHGGGARAQLERYAIPEPEPLTPAVIQEPLTPLELAHSVFKSNKIL